MPMKGVAAILVAAGESRRLGQPKQLLLINGEPMLQRAIRIAAEAGTSPIFVVLGAFSEFIEIRVDLGATTIVVHDEWQEGLASTLRAGMRAVEREAADASGLLLMACD